MQITLLMVMSVDGKTTKGGGQRVYTWTSSEDKKHFKKTERGHNLFFIGRKTFDVYRSYFEKLPHKPVCVVLTRDRGYIKAYKKKKYGARVEFFSGNVKTLVTQKEKQGFRKALLLGGSQTNQAFFRARLVNKISLTIEPILFGTGRPLIGVTNLSTKLKLENHKKLNQQGTVLFLYKVVG